MRKKEYSNGEITVIWEEGKCIHSAKCVQGLAQVFDIQKRPWINIKGAETDQICKQVDLCPSKALTWYSNNKEDTTMDDNKEKKSIEFLPNGPILISGQVSVKHSDGREEVCDNPALCRCGGSANKPFCDGAHNKNGFEG